MIDEKRYRVIDYVKMLEMFEKQEIVIDLLLALYDEPYVKTRFFTDTKQIDCSLNDKKVEHFILSVDSKTKKCSVSLLVDENECGGNENE